MAVTTTPLGFQKPDGNESIRNGDNVISANAELAQTLIAGDRGRLGAIEAKNIAQDNRMTGIETTNTAQGARLTSIEAKDVTQDALIAEVDGRYDSFSARIGQAEANIAAGAGGDGLGLTEDPDNPGTYFMADITPIGPIQPDPATPGLYTF